jgi:transposase
VNHWPGSVVEAVMQDAPAMAGSNLPEDPALLQAMIRELLTTNQQLQRRSDQLEHRLDQLLKRLYGPRADRVNPDQARLFDEPPPEPPLLLAKSVVEA